MPNVLRHRGIEAWLENSNGQPIALGENPNVDSNNISTWVNVKPRQSYTLRWRTSAGSSPRSALCEVLVKDGLYTDCSDSFEVVSTSMMDARRRITQNKTTKGWLNPPYSRFGCLRVRRRIVEAPTKTQPEILLLGSVRLEVRRVSGLFWAEGDDSDDDSHFIFDPDGIEVKDDAAQGKPPYITFDFKFREDPKITRMNQQMAEENEDTKTGVRVSRMSSKSGMLALPAISREEDVAPGPSIGPSTHTSGSLVPLILPDRNPKIIKVTRPVTEENVVKLGWNHLNKEKKGKLPVPVGKSDFLALPGRIDLRMSKSAARLVLSKAEGIPVVTPGPSIGPSTNASLLPLIHRGEFVSKSLPPTTTEDTSHTEMILSCKSAMPTSECSTSQTDLTNTPNPGIQIGCSNGELNGQPPATTHHSEMTLSSTKPSIPTSELSTAQIDITATAKNPGMQIGRSDGELDGQAPATSTTQAEDTFHTEMILSTGTEPAMPTSEPSMAQMDIDIKTAANPGMQIGRSESDGELDGRPPATTTQAEDTLHAEMIFSTESAMRTSEPPPAPMDTTSNSGMQTLGRSDRDGNLDGPSLGVLPSEGMPTGSFHSRNSPGRDFEHETDSHIEIPLVRVCEPPQINEQQSTEGGDRALTVKNNSDTVELSSSRKGKRKMIDRVGDSIAARDGEFKRNRTMVEDSDDDSDIEYLRSWNPSKTLMTRKKAVKIENVAIKLENIESDSVEPSSLPTVTVKSERFKIKLEDNQFDGKRSINEMMENYDSLQRRKKELEQKLAVKMEAQTREIEELLRRLDD